jgi:hypothetical protein
MKYYLNFKYLENEYCNILVKLPYIPQYNYVINNVEINYNNEMIKINLIVKYVVYDSYLQINDKNAVYNVMDDYPCLVCDVYEKRIKEEFNND